MIDDQTRTKKARTIRLYMSKEEYEVTKIALKFFLYSQSNNHDRTDADTAEKVLSRIKDCERLQIGNQFRREF